MPTSGSELDKKALAEFPSTGERAYLDTACIGIASQRAVRAVGGFLEQVEAVPVDSGTAHHGRLNDARAAAAPGAALLIGAQPQDIALVESTTHGLNIAASALPLQPGDVVAMADTEYIGMGVTWSQMARNGVKMIRIPHTAGKISTDTLREHLDSGVSALALSSVQWTSGFRADLPAVSQMCRERGVLLVVDAAQHIGAMPFDVTETPVDVLVCGGHKWLNSPFGTGFLYFSPEIRDRLLRPVSGFFAATPPGRTWGESFLDPGISPFQDFYYTGETRAWEIGGTGNYPGGIGLAAAIDLVLDIGMDTIADRIVELTDQLLEGLDGLAVDVVTPREHRHRSGIVTFTVGAGAADDELMRQLLIADVAVSVRYAGGVGGIRVSCHWSNTHSDVTRLLEALSDLVGTGPRTADGARCLVR